MYALYVAVVAENAKTDTIGTPDPIRPTRWGPDPNRPTRRAMNSDNNNDQTTHAWFHSNVKQEAQLSQRDRATLPVIEYFAQGHSRSFEMTLLSRARVSPYSSISLKLCLYVEPFKRYSASKNGVTLKLKVGVVQGHWKWWRLIDYMTSYWSAIVSIAVCCTNFKLFDVE